ncbi:MAG: metallophosphoesterase, partial [Verrucomicrobiota bacterium]
MAKRIAKCLGVLICILCLATARGHEGHDHFHSGVTSEKTPWTHLNFLDDPNDFRFAIVTDRTGSPRKGVFESAVPKINWMRPEFVMSVGDLIQGNQVTEQGNFEEWEEFMGFVEPLEMPFFFLAGNHDIQAKPEELRKGRVPYELMLKHWKDRFGATYYYFVYKNVLFLALFSNDGKEQSISAEQIGYFRKVLAEHEDVRWTMVFLHHPLWLYAHESNFDKVEEMLKGRKHTVFAGHQHRYLHMEREDANYYVLATTGGGSPLRGTQFGEFDHITWVTMTDEGPVMANLELDGILPHDVSDMERLKLAISLTENASTQARVVLNEGRKIERGTLFLEFRNDSAERMKIDGAFLHSHWVSPLPARVEEELSAGERRIVEIELRTFEPFPADSKGTLEFEAEYALLPSGEEPISLAGRNEILLESADMNLLGSESRVFVDSLRVELSQPSPSSQVRYTLDGSVPTEKSRLYRKPFLLKESTLVKARLFTKSGLATRVSECRFEEVGAGQGLLCDYFEYEGTGTRKSILPDYHTMRPVSTTVEPRIDLESVARRERYLGMVYYGYIDIPESGEYTFYLSSDDGARLLINGETVIDDPIKHPPREA